ncbi:MAG TPA: YIP1 family protein [Veillonellaceae bacterium]|uniref:YIP1 family protein n=1 Tax=Dialister succinatiphilus TaxID=487173 RepID=UPI002598D5FE|nr:YIP1 family protein [uncultured Dialister sp.]HJI28760.1 YIP1 family protein [Veillonellaceae bacterium]
MNQLLDLAMALIISPRQALMEITNEEKLKEGFFIWIFVVLLMSLSLFQQGPGLVMQFLLMVLFMGAALLVHSAVIDYISGFWGGMGTARGITAGFMAASLPMAFSVFFTFLAEAGVGALPSIGSFAIWIWSFYLDVTAIGQNYRFRPGKSFLIALTPYILIVIFFIALMALGVAAAVEGIANMQDMQSLESMINQM